VAHGEGRLGLPDEAARAALWAGNQAALQYVAVADAAQRDETPPPPWPWRRRAGYPPTPNGSVDDLAGICNAAGNVFGLMPHPEDHILAQQHPRWTRGAVGPGPAAL
jgi:phosphoribosylformylglycinamidine synthase